MSTPDNPGIGGKKRQRNRRNEDATEPAPRSPQPPSVVPKKSSVVMLLLAAVLLWSVFAASVLWRTPTSDANDFVLGQKLHTDVYAEASFSYVDTAATAIKQRRAAEKVYDIYRIDETANRITQQHFEQLQALVKAELSEDLPSPLFDGGISDSVLRVYRALDREQVNSLITLFDTDDKRNFLQQTLQAVLLEGVVNAVDRSPDAMAREICILDTHLRKKTATLATVHTPSSAAKMLIDTYAKQFTFANPAAQERLSENALAKLLWPNLLYEAILTEKERKAARESVAPERIWVREGTAFLHSGDIVTDDVLRCLQYHREAITARIDSTQYFLTMASLLALGFLTIVIGAAYLCQQEPKLLATPSALVLIAGVLSLNIVFIRGMEQLVLVLTHGSRMYVYPLLPIAFSAALVTLLLGKRAGLSAGIVMSLLAGWMVTEPTHVFVLGLFSSFAGSLMIAGTRTRIRTFRSAATIAASVFIVESIYLVLNSTPWSVYLTVLGIAFLNGLSTILIVNLVLPAAESLSGVTTDISLLELSDLNHPLLKRLQIEAPGTYHHTLMVAALSENAANAVGANGLLARVATYFHDVGKLANPSYFTENSFGVDRHQDLSPRMSALIILNHVKEGLALAKKYRLKQPIRDAIASHHGTSLVHYFYQRARTDQKPTTGREIDEGDFRYPGPLPKTKEASIICLADSCEAASRCLNQATPKKIANLVRDIVWHKISDGQLAASDLTMAEIDTVTSSIMTSLITMFHGRIAYPRLHDNESIPDQSTDHLPAADEKADATNPQSGRVHATEDVSADRG